jgi:hypothetical protein
MWRKSRTNAITPLVQLSVIFAPSLLLAARFLGGSMAVAAFIAALSVIVAPFVAYFYFMLKNPDRLHSETYLFKRHQLNMLAKGPDGAAKLGSPSAQASKNPIAETIASVVFEEDEGGQEKQKDGGAK